MTTHGTALSAVDTADEALIRLDPGLHKRFRAALPWAADVVCRRLLAALHRERLAEVRACGTSLTLPGGATVPVREHGFDRLETGTLPGDPMRHLGELTALVGGGLGVELTDAVTNLAVGYARRPSTMDPFGPAATADEQMLGFERLATEGHNLHPCARTRLGWRMADVLAHDLEAEHTRVEFVAVRRELHLGEDIGARLGRQAPPGYVAQPVHRWQLENVRRQHPALFASRALVTLEGTGMQAAPTAALRTLLLTGEAAGGSRYLKLSLDIQVTSTRRTISVASTRNGPVLSVLLGRLLADEPVLVLAEPAGAAVTASGVDRQLSAIVRSGLSGRLIPGEVPVPGGALYAHAGGRTVLAALVARYASTRGRRDDAATALAFFSEYAALVLPPLLRLATRYGVALEAHLQNSIPTFVAGVPHRLVVRDFAGMRIYLPRLAARATTPPLWPGSLIGTNDIDVMRAKLGYTALQAHLGELVVRLVDSHAMDEPAAWLAVRGVIERTYAELRAHPALAADATADYAFFTAPHMPHKALVRMRLCDTGDLYVPVSNPLR
jgi:siderophore synthetase component